MDKYFNTYREMISLRGLADHTLTSYSMYIRSYLDYLSDVLHKMPEEVSWEELRDHIRWLQKETFSFRPYNQCLYLAAPLLYHVCAAQTLGSHSAPYEEVRFLSALCPGSKRS